MDKQYILSKVKKYLFFISMLFLVVTSSHLIYTFIYSDSKEVAEKGGTISEGVIGNFPHLNPLKKSNDYNDYINHILYRSLLTYNIKKQKIEGDLANCNINDLAKIECFLNENIKWSDGEAIKSEDIIATYDIIKNTNVNPILKSLVENLEIKVTDSSIIFTSEKEDINTLNLFFQPILPTKVINSLKENEISGNFSPIEGIYSGMYTITKVDQDDTLGITKIFLEKNKEYASNPAYIDKIIFKVFKDTSHFLKHKSTINIFNDKSNLIGNSIPKFKSYKYELPQYVGLFVNTEKLPYVNLRNFILRSVNNEELVERLGTNNFKAVNDPFLNGLYLNTLNQTTDLKTMLESLGYYTKEKIIALLAPDAIKSTYSDEVKINNLVNNTPITDTQTGTINSVFQNITKENYLKNSEIITSPEWVDNYNYVSKDDTLLTGKAEAGVSAIYINDYKLQGYNAGDKEFHYRIKKSYNTLVEGKNEYNIYFEKDGNKELIETIVFFYSENQDKLTEYENSLIEELSKKQTEEKQKKIQESLEAQISSTDSSEYKDLIKKLNGLEDNFYYNKDLEAYSLNLHYLIDNVDNEKTVNFVKEKLEKQGIKIKTQSLGIEELRKLLISGEKEYDLLITGINLGYFNFNLFPYLHSSQVKSGYNFSKYKKLSLDQILEELKSHNLSKEKALELEKKIIEILKEDAVFKTLYTPLYSNLVDKTIEGYSLDTLIPSEIYRYDPIITSYVSRERIINKEGKDTIGFIKFLFSTLF
ncbi:MAG: ABC transporter substrate-binding protein [Candidatus Gracilibacteria bacterium]|nr:ABC transporter substrate-binding protein [Candidatus Gracilibacteria bacterium]